MNEKMRGRIQQLIGEFQCPHDFSCTEDEDFRKGVEAGAFDHLRCFSLDVQDCPFEVPLQVGPNCSCPLRLYLCRQWIEQNLKVD